MYNRIAIIGAPGTGKTTLANNLSEILKADLIIWLEKIKVE